MLTDKRIDLERLATHRFSIDEAETAFRMFDERKTEKAVFVLLEEPTMAFKYAFNTWCYSSFPVWVPSYPLEETAKRIARAGYDGIEIGCAAPHACPAHLVAGAPQGAEEVIEGEGLAVSSPAAGPGRRSRQQSCVAAAGGARRGDCALQRSRRSRARSRRRAGALYRRLARFGVNAGDALGWTLDCAHRGRQARREQGRHDLHRADLGGFQSHRHCRPRSEAARGLRASERQGDVRHLPRAVSQRSQLRLRLRDGAASRARAFRGHRPPAARRGSSRFASASCRR